MTKNIQDPDGDVHSEQSSEKKNDTRSIYVGDAQWEKLVAMRDELGSWNLLVNVAIEQLLASGLISEETRNKIHEINQSHGTDCLGDTAWRDAFKIREPWPEAARHLRVIKETLAEIKDSLGYLAQTVDDHATAMLEAEVVKPGEPTV